MNWVFDDAQTLLTMTACPHTIHGEQTQLLAGRFPMANLFHYFKNNWWNRADHDWRAWGLNERPQRYAYNIGTWNDPGYWTGWPGNEHGYENFMLYVPDMVLSDARDGGALLVIDNLNEGFYDTKLYQFLHETCYQFDLPPNAICLMTGNELDGRGYDEWCNQQGIRQRMHVIGMPHLMYMQQLNLRNSNMPSWEDHLVAKQLRADVCTFNCLNRMNRNPRELFVIKLIERDLHVDNMVSHNQLAYHAWIHHGVPQTVIDKASAVLPLIVDDADFGNNKAMHINTDIYLRSWATMVNETHAFDESHNLFISEKIWKPVFALSPFMVWGHAGTLDLMHRWGYETWPDLWDESYDTMPDMLRMETLLDNLQALRFVRDKRAWWLQARERCLHNQQHFMKQDWFNSPYHQQFMAAYNGLNS